MALDMDTLLFFGGHQSALPLYQAFESILYASFPNVNKRVQKTQITFYNRHVFACVSFARVKRKAELPEGWLDPATAMAHTDLYRGVLIIIALIYILAAMIRLAYFNATEEEREKEIRENGVAYFTGLPVTSAAIVFPMVLLLHYIPRFDLSVPYFIVMMVMACLFVGRFKIRKPGRKGVWIMVGIGFAEFVAFMILMSVTSR